MCIRDSFGIDKERVRVIDGGADRNGTVMNLSLIHISFLCSD